MKCTCSEIRKYDPLNKKSECPIHGKNGVKVEQNQQAFMQDQNGHLIVCLCECGCGTCKYTPLADLLAQNTRVKVYYVDRNYVRHEVTLTDTVPTLPKNPAT